MRDFLGGSSGGRRFGGAVMNVKLTEIKNNGTPWLKIPADGSQIKFTGNADEAAKEFFNALIRVRDGYISALKAERDAQQKRADALAVENAALKSRSIKLFNLGYLHGHESTVEGYFVDVHRNDIDTYHDDVVAEIIEDEDETPATDAALAAIQAQGLENARYSMSAGHADQRMAESRSVRAALGFNPDADDVSPSDLVDAINKINAELCVIRSAHPQPLGNAMDAAIDAFNAEEMPETGMLNAYFIMRDSIRVETPATDEALAAIQAQGVEKFADMCREKSKLATTADSCAGWKNCSVHASSFAIRLREAK